MCHTWALHRQTRPAASSSCSTGRCQPAGLPMCCLPVRLVLSGGASAASLPQPRTGIISWQSLTAHNLLKCPSALQLPPYHLAPAGSGAMSRSTCTSPTQPTKSTKQLHLPTRRGGRSAWALIQSSWQHTTTSGCQWRCTGCAANPHSLLTLRGCVALSPSNCSQTCMPAESFTTP